MKPDPHTHYRPHGRPDACGATGRHFRAFGASATPWPKQTTNVGRVTCPACLRDIIKRATRNLNASADPSTNKESQP